MARRIDMTLQDLEALRDRIDRRQLDSGDWVIVGALVSARIDREAARVRRLQEKLTKQSPAENGTPSTTEGGADEAGPSGAAEPEPSEPKPSEPKPSEPEPTDPEPSNAEPNDDDERADDSTGAVGAKRCEADDERAGGEPKKGHGRLGAAAFTNANEYPHELESGMLGATCQGCQRGRMTRYRDKVIIRIVGQPLFGAERHRFEQARCRLCGAVIRADGAELAMDGIGTSYVTYHWSACAMLIVMHYFAGAPFKRLEALHRGWGIPMSDANQWRLVDECDDLLAPLYRAIEMHAIRHATTLRIDDTGSMIIELRKQIRQEVDALERLGEPTRNVRTGINATCVYLETGEATVVLYFTGRHHAGEIIDQILTHRRTGTQPGANKIVKVSDAASKNFDHAHGDVLEEAVCHAHAYLKFRAVKDSFPAEYAIAGDVYKNIFDHDDHAKALGLDPEERMRYHRQHSKPEMERLKTMCKDKLKAKLVEPNSPLWEPVSFIINQWTRLTRFYEIPGVPLDTNIVEQSLIIPVRYLAGSFAYKTQNGADVGDRHMSLVVTANANGVEPVAYLTECLHNHKDLARRPEHYLPWVYKTRVDASQSELADDGSNDGPPPDTPEQAPVVGPTPTSHRPVTATSTKTPRPHPLSIPSRKPPPPTPTTGPPPP